MKPLHIDTPIVSVNWLAEYLEHPDLMILDASIKKVTATTPSVDQQLQIKGARFFDIKKSFSDLTTDIPTMLATPDVFQKNCRALGINNNSILVIYDTLGIYSSPRAWWMFTSMGFDTVAVLDGGLPAWIAASLPTEHKNEQAVYELGDCTVHHRSKCMVTKEDIRSGIHDPLISILDARSSGRFSGTAPEPRADLKSGHIPTAINLPYTTVLDNGKMRPIEQLTEIFEILQLKNNKIYGTCGSGITACIILLAAQLAGYQEVAVYDGSWSEWGCTEGLPIEC